MTVQFKIIHFVPDPFSGARVPVGVVARRGYEDAQVIIAPRIPGPSCVGGEVARANLALVLEDLRRLRDFDADVGLIGPHLVASDVKSLDIRGDLTKWFREVLFPTPDESEPRSRSPRRATEGRLYLQRRNVDVWVKPTFRPVDYWTSHGHRAAFEQLDPISLYVGDRGGEILLLEPLIPRRSSFAADVREVNMRFAAYRHFLNVRGGNSTDLVAFILPGDSEDRRTARKALEDSAHQVVDTENPAERDDFLARVREVGRASEQPPLL